MAYSQEQVCAAAKPVIVRVSAICSLTRQSYVPDAPTTPKRRPRGLTRYKRSETARLLKGAIDAGLTVRGIEVDPVTGALRVLVGEPGKGKPDDADLDRELAER